MVTFAIISSNKYKTSRNKSKSLLGAEGGFEHSLYHTPFNSTFDNLLVSFKVIEFIK